MRNPPTKRRIIRREGAVNLVELRKAGSALIYAVTYPKKIGSETSATLRESQVFTEYIEATVCFERFAKFFGGNHALGK